MHCRHAPKKNKCNPDCDTVVDAPKEFLDYWFFNTGSYWVYKLAETSATILDTVKITFSKTSFVSACENVPYPCRRSYSCNFSHSNKIFKRAFYPFPTEPQERFLTDVFSDAWVLRHAPISSNVARSDEVLKMSLTKGTKLSNEGEIVDTSTIITPYGKISSVLEVFKRQKSPEGEGYDGLYYRRLFFAKGIGIVKYEYTNNQTWELLDYKLN